MKKLLVALALTFGIALSCSAAVPSVEADCTESFSHVGSGGKLVVNGSSWTTPFMAPNENNLVFVFVSLATGNTAPTPTLTGESVTWTRLDTWYKKDQAPRNLSVFYAIGAQPGTLTIGGFGPTGKTHLTWSVAQGGDTIVQYAVNTQGGLETSHSVTLGDAPEGAVVAGFLVGQQGTVDDGPPYVDLGQGHTSFFTTFTEWDVDGPGDYQTATAYWAQPGHAIGVAYEVTCSEE